MVTRRDFIVSTATIALLPLTSCSSRPTARETSVWPKASALAASIAAPEIPDRSVSIVEFNPSEQDALPSIKRAMRALAEHGGGRLVIPAGNWNCDGPIHLGSKIDLHVSEGALLRFLPNPESYLPPVLTRWEGTEVYTYSPFIFAQNKTDVSLSGKGKIDGQGRQHWLPWRRDQGPIKKILRDMGRDGVPIEDRVFIGDRRLRPHFVQFHGCERVLVEDVTLIDSPFWIVHPVYCSDVIVRRITCISDHLNSDGVDPDSSRRVLIEDCEFAVGDDGVAIKAGRDQDGWRVGRPCEDIVVRNCRFTGDTGGAFAIGSEMSGGVRNVFLENFTVGDANHVFYLKANKDRGGVIENIWARNITAGNVHTAIIFTNAYHSYRGGTYPTLFRKVFVENMTVESAELGISLQGNADAPINDVQFKDVSVKEAEIPIQFEHVNRLDMNNVLVNGRTASLDDAVPFSTDRLTY